MQIKVDIQGEKELQRAIKKYPGLTERNLEKGIKKTMLEVQRQARSKHRFKSKTHNLERSVSYHMPGKLKGEIYLDTKLAKYGAYVHEGTRSYHIRPKQKRALRWVYGSGYSYAKGVEHPGLKADPFLYDAAKDKDDVFRSNISEAIEQSIKEAGLN